MLVFSLESTLWKYEGWIYFKKKKKTLNLSQRVLQSLILPLWCFWNPVESHLFHNPTLPNTVSPPDPWGSTECLHFCFLPDPCPKSTFLLLLISLADNPYFFAQEQKRGLSVGPQGSDWETLDNWEDWGNKCYHTIGRHKAKAYLPTTPPSTDSWLPASLGVLTEGDIGVGTK